MPAVIILWGAPGRTHDLWAWTIKPDLTPIFLGSGYGAGAYFFWRTFRASCWHPSSAGVFSAAGFAAAMRVLASFTFLYRTYNNQVAAAAR